MNERCLSWYVKHMILISQELPSVMLFYEKRYFIHFSRVDQIHILYRTDISVEIKIEFAILVNKKKIWNSTISCNKYISIYTIPNTQIIEKVISHSLYHYSIPIYLMCIPPLHTAVTYIKGFQNKCGIGIKCEIMKILNRISTHSSDFLIHEN